MPRAVVMVPEGEHSLPDGFVYVADVEVRGKPAIEIESDRIPPDHERHVYRNLDELHDL